MEPIDCSSCPHDPTAQVISFPILFPSVVDHQLSLEGAAARFHSLAGFSPAVRPSSLPSSAQDSDHSDFRSATQAGGQHSRSGGSTARGAQFNSSATHGSDQPASRSAAHHNDLHGPGLGLYINGAALPGTVVSFFPGVIYRPPHHRFLPDFPLVDRNNSYLTSRFDATVVDSKPWGQGGRGREVWSGVGAQAHSWWDERVRRASVGDEKGGGNKAGLTSASLNRLLVGWLAGARDTPGKRWDADEAQVAAAQAATAAEVERRNPLAVAHFANHPSSGPSFKPNVMMCPFDFPTSVLEASGLSLSDLRAYVPNVVFRPRARAVAHFHDDEDEEEESVVPMVLMVAKEPVKDEELFLNYRLSPHVTRPPWYVPVDDKEDHRRWA